ncbi:lipase family protein [Antrihabitans sp. NCIMB 15449]|uniref:Lipase family protein n=1 Tax=Antrihabitans spumae TaxID=3373370 RepID=A0ABW7JI35_9NOCA
MACSQRSRRALLVISAVMVACAATTSSTVASADPVVTQPALPFPIPPLPPEFDPNFYNPPLAAYEDKQPGEIIAARQVNLGFSSVLPINAASWQLSYRSTNTRGEPISAVTTVLQPRKSKGPVRDKLLSYQFPIDSLAHYCDPSYVLQLASIPGALTGQPGIPVELLIPIAAAELGWTVSMPDHQGPNAAFAAGPLAGRITLDGVRATENFAEAGLAGTSTKVALAGYSGGAIATGHAAELHASYAPDLNIVGAAEGGIPADLNAALNMANNNAGAGIVWAGAIGVSREYPELAQYFAEHINDFGKGLTQAKDNLCLAYQAASFPFLNMKGLFDTAEPLNEPVPAAVLDRIRMGHVVPDVPMYMYQANPDWLIPVGPVNNLVNTYCQSPTAQVRYTRDHFSEHATLPFLAVPSVIMWLKDRLDGIPAEPGCSTTDVGSIALDQSAWPLFAGAVGPLVADLFGKPVGE